MKKIPSSTQRFALFFSLSLAPVGYSPSSQNLNEITDYKIKLSFFAVFVPYSTLHLCKYTRHVNFYPLLNLFVPCIMGYYKTLVVSTALYGFWAVKLANDSIFIEAGKKKFSKLPPCVLKCTWKKKKKSSCIIPMRSPIKSR